MDGASDGIDISGHNATPEESPSWPFALIFGAMRNPENWRFPRHRRLLVCEQVMLLSWCAPSPTVTFETHLTTNSSQSPGIAEAMHGVLLPSIFVL